MKSQPFSADPFLFDQFNKTIQRRGCPLGHATAFDQILSGPPQRTGEIPRMGTHCIQRLGADATRRHIDRTLE